MNNQLLPLVCHELQMFWNDSNSSELRGRLIYEQNVSEEKCSIPYLIILTLDKANLSQGMLTIIRCRIFCLPV